MLKSDFGNIGCADGYDRTIRSLSVVLRFTEENYWESRKIFQIFYQLHAIGYQK